MDFGTIVEENEAWLMRYLRKVAGSRETAEDLLQETFIRAFKAWDGYTETGQLRQWLKAIARNAALRHMRRESLVSVTLFTESPGDDCMPGNADPISRAEEGELRQRLLSAIARLPREQGLVVYHRYFKDLGVSEVSDITGIPEGSVKSKAHYGLGKVRKTLYRYFVEGGYVMDCMEAYAYLFQYAKGKIAPNDGERVKDHLAVCESCRDRVDAMKALTQGIIPPEEGVLGHFHISFQLDGSKMLSYTHVSFDIPQWEEMNQRLMETDGHIPDGENWFGSGHNDDLEHLAEFDNEGNRLDFELVRLPGNPFPGNVRVRHKRLRRIFPRQEFNSVYIVPYTLAGINYDAPGLYTGKMQNHLGNSAKSGLYLAIPGRAGNIRIKRGNGVIDCGPYKFAYAERYVTEDENLRLECTFVDR